MYSYPYRQQPYSPYTPSPSHNIPYAPRQPPVYTSRHPDESMMARARYLPHELYEDYGHTPYTSAYPNPSAYPSQQIRGHPKPAVYQHPAANPYVSDYASDMSPQERMYRAQHPYQAPIAVDVSEDEEDSDNGDPHYIPHQARKRRGRANSTKRPRPPQQLYQGVGTQPYYAQQARHPQSSDAPSRPFIPTGPQTSRTRSQSRHRASAQAPVPQVYAQPSAPPSAPPLFKSTSTSQPPPSKTPSTPHFRPAPAPAPGPQPVPHVHQYTPAHQHAASTIQSAYRKHLALRRIRKLHEEFHQARKQFEYPRIIEFQVPRSAAGTGGSGSSSSNIVSVAVDPPRKPTETDQLHDANVEDVPHVSPGMTGAAATAKLAYTSHNYPLHAYQESLQRLLTALDGIDSQGERNIREKRRRVIREVEKEAAVVEMWWRAAWARYVQSGKEYVWVERDVHGRIERGQEQKQEQEQEKDAQQQQQQQQQRHDMDVDADIVAEQNDLPGQAVEERQRQHEREVVVTVETPSGADSSNPPPSSPRATVNGPTVDDPMD